jgi:hypothetical protein
MMRSQGRWRPGRTAPATAMALLMLLLATPAAFAQDSSISIEMRDDAGNVVPRMSADGLYPTLTVRHTVFVEVDEQAPAGRVGTEISNLVDYENGCNRPELQAGDTTCGDPGPGEGELSTQLEITWTVGSVSDDACVLGDVVGPHGERLRDVADTQVDVGELPASRQLCFEFAMEFLGLPENNLAQTDSVTFDIRVGIQETTDTGNGSDEQVAGMSIERPGTPEVSRGGGGGGGGTVTTVSAAAATQRPSGVPLGRTGLGAGQLLLLAAANLLVGLAAIRESRRRSQRSRLRAWRLATTR